MAKPRKPRRFKNRPFFFDSGDENADWVKQPRSQKDDLRASDDALKIHEKREKGK